MADRLIERAADARIQAVAGIAEVVEVQDETTVRAATTDRGIGLADCCIPTGTDGCERLAGALPHVRIWHGATMDEGIMRAAGVGVTGGHGGKVQALEPQESGLQAGVG